MKRSSKHVLITNSNPNRNVSTSPLARRLALIAVIALLIGMSFSLRPMRVVRASTITVTAGPDVDAANNDYRRIQNAINAAGNGDTIMLSGTFDFTQPFAAAAWALGNDNTPATADDYEVFVPAGVNNVTITASSLGAATIQGPGDLAAVNLEGVFVFDGANQGWTISNIRFMDFDLSIGFFAITATDFNNTKIINNYIKIARDLNATVAPADVNQNIGIHFSFGANQMISGNTIEFAGDGVSDSAMSNFSSEVGMQSNVSGGNVYDGLQITNNILRVVNAQSADPEVILGIWENGLAHTSNITISGNQFINLSMGNNAATNQQHAFRVTSHSSPTTTVKYQNNSTSGANIGFQWLAGSNFSGNQPVQLISNNILNGGTGVLIQSEGLATLSFNRIVGNVVALNNATSNPINAENNWWGCNFGPGVGGAGCAGTPNGVICTLPDSASTGHKNKPGADVSCLVDFDPWLVLGLTAVPNTILAGGTSTLTADLTFNSDNVDTHLSGNIPDGTPVAFAGNAFGSVAPSSTSTTSGKANSTYTGTAPGTGDVTTTVDMQTVSTRITVNPAPCVITCPANVTQNNDPDKCGAAVNYPPPQSSENCSGSVSCDPGPGTFFPVGTTTVTCSNQSIIPGLTGSAPSLCIPRTLTESTTQDITPNNSYSCNNGVAHSDNSYWRAFNLPGSFFIGNAFDVQSVDIGIQSATSDAEGMVSSKGSAFSRSNQKGKAATAGPGQAVTIRLYADSPGSFPGGARTEIASATFTIADQSLTVVNLPITGTVPAGSELVVEVFTPSGQGGRGNFLFFIGSNSDPETGPSYVSAPDCGTSVPTTTSDLGFPDMHIVMNVNGCEEMARCTFTVTVQDTQAPTITCSDVSQCNDTNQCSAVVSFAPQVNDNCPNATADCSPASGSSFPKGVTTVTCTAADAAENYSSPCSFTVTVNDCQNPTITCPADIARGTDPNQCSAMVTYPAPTVSDNCPDVGTLACSPASGSTFPKGTTTVTCTVSDASNNMSACSFTVTVQDTINPTITCPANVTQCNDTNQCGAGVSFAPNVNDNCPNATAACSPASGSSFPKGVTTVTCTATDAAGNHSSPCSFTVTVNDCQNPTITCPANITRGTDPNLCSAVVTYPAPAVSDNCPGVGTPTCSPASGSTFPKGTTTVTCSVRDASNNMSACSFTVTVQDTQPPTIMCPPNITFVAAATCPPTNSMPVNFTVTASDNCPGVTVVCRNQNGVVVTSGLPFPVGTTTVTCTATDASGNTTACSFTISGFNFCLQDEDNPGNVVLINALTGDYRFCCGGVPVATGRGTLTTRGCIGSIDDAKGDRRVHIQWDTSANGAGAGTAIVQVSPNKTVCQITDKKMTGNTCLCAAQPPPG